MMPALLPFALSLMLSEIPDTPKDVPHAVTIEILVCQSTKLDFHFNDDAEMRWDRCKTPLKGARLIASPQGGDRMEAETDEHGLAQLGPITLSGKQQFGLAMIFTPKLSAVLNGLFVGGPIHDGHNKMLIYTGPSMES